MLVTVPMYFVLGASRCELNGDGPRPALRNVTCASCVGRSFACTLPVAFAEPAKQATHAAIAAKKTIRLIRTLFRSFLRQGRRTRSCRLAPRSRFAARYAALVSRTA